LASILIGFVALALLLERLARGKAKFHETGRRDRRPPRIRLKGAGAAGAVLACSLPPLFGFLVPALVLGELLIESGGPTRDFGRHLFNSLTLAGIAAAVVTAGALVPLARKERRTVSQAGPHRSAVSVTRYRGR
jgi:iron(III) transport system permease protein